MSEQVSPTSLFKISADVGGVVQTRVADINLSFGSLVDSAKRLFKMGDATQVTGFTCEHDDDIITIESDEELQAAFRICHKTCDGLNNSLPVMKLKVVTVDVKGHAKSSDGHGKVKNLFIPESEAIKLNTQGAEFFRQSKYEDALKAFSDALALEPENEMFLVNRASTLINLERYGDAIIDCDTVLQKNPSIIKAYVKKGRALLRLQKFSDAVAVLDAGLKRPNIDNNEKMKNELQDGLTEAQEALAKEQERLEKNDSLAATVRSAFQYAARVFAGAVSDTMTVDDFKSQHSNASKAVRRVDEKGVNDFFKAMGRQGDVSLSCLPTTIKDGSVVMFCCDAVTGPDVASLAVSEHTKLQKEIRHCFKTVHPDKLPQVDEDIRSMAALLCSALEELKSELERRFCAVRVVDYKQRFKEIREHAMDPSDKMSQALKRFIDASDEFERESFKNTQRSLIYTMTRARKDLRKLNYYRLEVCDRIIIENCNFFRQNWRVNIPVRIAVHDERPYFSSFKLSATLAFVCRTYCGDRRLNYEDIDEVSVSYNTVRDLSTQLNELRIAGTCMIFIKFKNGGVKSAESGASEAGERKRRRSPEEGCSSKDSPSAKRQAGGEGSSGGKPSAQRHAGGEGSSDRPDQYKCPPGKGRCRKCGEFIPIRSLKNHTQECDGKSAL